ncbi:hypothetical protein BP00DRAFT_238304 [Aspergillus indologenus CBS 114.80]|uniref:Uncharacterized protein n=1 Tax=Aspergillus indologenus CBS 114.80 TaxID=1450541 RepID=A0A2V5IYJ6_9EURO|nr:hypothetical protein BP00DRAFT_238304 [Aspergillus indologenus CBS 114.80]
MPSSPRRRPASPGDEVAKGSMSEHWKIQQRDRRIHTSSPLMSHSHHDYKIFATISMISVSVISSRCERFSRSSGPQKSSHLLLVPVPSTFFFFPINFFGGGGGVTSASCFIREHTSPTDPPRSCLNPHFSHPFQHGDPSLHLGARGNPPR